MIESLLVTTAYHIIVFHSSVAVKFVPDRLNVVYS